MSCTRTGKEWQADPIAEIAESLPRLRMVIEHLGGWNLAYEEPAPYERRTSMIALARFPNISIKPTG